MSGWLFRLLGLVRETPDRWPAPPGKPAPFRHPFRLVGAGGVVLLALGFLPPEELVPRSDRSDRFSIEKRERDSLPREIAECFGEEEAGTFVLEDECPAREAP